MKRPETRKANDDLSQTQFEESFMITETAIEVFEGEGGTVTKETEVKFTKLRVRHCKHNQSIGSPCVMIFQSFTRKSMAIR
jgi:hypothetical protein